MNVAHAHCMLDNWGYRNTEYVIVIAFPRQQWLRERASLLTFILCCLSWFSSLKHRACWCSSNVLDARFEFYLEYQPLWQVFPASPRAAPNTFHDNTSIKPRRRPNPIQLPTSYHLTLCSRGGHLDELREPHRHGNCGCMRQVKPYGSNTADCLRERSQRKPRCVYRCYVLWSDVAS